MSQGYLSRLKAGAGNPSSELVLLLALLSMDGETACGLATILALDDRSWHPDAPTDGANREIRRRTTKSGERSRRRTIPPEIALHAEANGRQSSPLPKLQVSRDYAFRPDSASATGDSPAEKGVSCRRPRGRVCGSASNARQAFGARLARLAGLCEATIKFIEFDKHSPTKQTRLKLLAISDLSLSTDELGLNPQALPRQSRRGRRSVCRSASFTESTSGSRASSDAA